MNTNQYSWYKVACSISECPSDYNWSSSAIIPFGEWGNKQHTRLYTDSPRGYIEPEENPRHLTQNEKFLFALFLHEAGFSELEGISS